MSDLTRPDDFSLTGAANQLGHDDVASDVTGDEGPMMYARPDCPRCGGTGLLEVFQPGQLAPGTVPCQCVEVGQRLAAADKRVELLFGKGGARMTINSFDPGSFQENQTALEVARNYVREFDEFAKRGEGFALQGEPGSGKTHLATGVLIALTKKRMAAGRDFKAFNLSVPEMLRLARKRFDDPNTGDVLDRAMSADLYLFDDIGAEYRREGSEGMSWVDEQLFVILNHRLNHNLPTIYTTNLSKRELAGRLDERITSRLDRRTLAFLPMKRVRKATEPSRERVNLLLHGK